MSRERYMTDGTKISMYNLLVSADEKAWDRQQFVLHTSRYLEHTEDRLRAQFSSLDDATIAKLTSMPALFAYEEPVGRPAHVGWIAAVTTDTPYVTITFRFDRDFAPVPPETLEALSAPLQIREWEMNRTHWAVKSVDLLGVLQNAPALVAAARAHDGQYHFSRQTLLKACEILKSLGHSDLDTLLLELGVDGLRAGRDVGSRANRVNRLAEVVVQHPEQKTAEGDQLGFAVVRAACRADPTYPAERFGLEPAARDAFWSALKQDGYKFSGNTVRADVPVDSTPPYAAPAPLTPSEPPTSTGSLATLPTRRRQTVVQAKQKVFIVHGRDDGAKHEVARYLAQLELEPIILHERPNGGRTLITKFQEESADIKFAVVLMTPDDVGGLAGEEQKRRARQNVIFELGFFMGKLGAGRVCALVAGDIEKPSDFDAVVYIAYGPATPWRMELARELRHAGIAFDASKVF